MRTPTHQRALNCFQTVSMPDYLGDVTSSIRILLFAKQTTTRQRHSKRFLETDNHLLLTPRRRRGSYLSRALFDNVFGGRIMTGGSTHQSESCPLGLARRAPSVGQARKERCYCPQHAVGMRTRTDGHSFARQAGRPGQARILQHIHLHKKTTMTSNNYRPRSVAEQFTLCQGFHS